MFLKLRHGQNKKVIASLSEDSASKTFD